MNENKPKVLMIIHMPPPVHGASMMGQYVFESTFINNKYECHYINETISADVSHVGKFGLYKVKTIIRHCKRLIKEIREFGPDLVYITPSAYQPEFGMIRYVFEFLILNHYKCKKLIHFHNKGDKGKCSKWYFRWYYLMLFRRSSVIFLADKLSNQFDWILTPKQVYICPNGIPEISSSHGIFTRNSEKIKLLFLSNLIESKGILVLLDAIQILSENGIDVYCDVVGAESVGINKARFDVEIKKRNLKDRVVYHGKRYGLEKYEFFRDADIFVFPTYFPGECFPLVLLEAMEFKLPLISTDNGAIEEIVRDGENGFICKQNDCDSLVEKLLILVNNKELRKKMGKNSYAFFKEKYTLERFEQRLADIIQKALV